MYMNLLCVIYNLIVIGIFAVLAYRLNAPWMVLCAILFLMQTIDYDDDINGDE